VKGGPIAVAASKAAKLAADEEKLGLDLDGYRMRIENMVLPEILMQQGALSAAEGSRIK